MNIFPFADYASDWYPKNAIELFKKYSTCQFVSNPAEADLIWVFSYYAAARLFTLPPFFYHYTSLSPRRRGVFLNKPILTTLHHLTPEKEEQWKPRVALLDSVTDAWQTFSHINHDFLKTYVRHPIHILPYWIDTTIFFKKSDEDRLALKKSLGLPLTKTIFGSFQRDTESDGVSPKLEKGPDIFCDIIEQLPPEQPFVLLAGPRRDYIERRLTAKNIPFKSLGKTSYDRMNDLYNALDYYLVSSRYEGGPQAILECLATHTKLFSTPVGITDILSPAVIFQDAAEAVTLLSRPYPPVLDKHTALAAAHDCKVVVPQFERFFQDFVHSYAS